MSKCKNGETWIQIKSSTYTIEEIIFYSERDAKVLLTFINQVRTVSYFWDTIDKYPSNKFLLVI